MASSKKKTPENERKVPGTEKFAHDVLSSHKMFLEAMKDEWGKEAFFQYMTFLVGLTFVREEEGEVKEKMSFAFVGSPHRLRQIGIHLIRHLISQYQKKNDIDGAQNFLKEMIDTALTIEHVEKIEIE